MSNSLLTGGLLGGAIGLLSGGLLDDIGTIAPPVPIKIDVGIEDKTLFSTALLDLAPYSVEVRESVQYSTGLRDSSLYLVELEDLLLSSVSLQSTT